MALGNIIGSNIANTFLVLGVSSILYALGLESKELKKQFGFHLVLSLIIAGVFYSTKVSPVTSLISVFFIFYFYINFKGENEVTDEEIDVSKFDYKNNNWLYSFIWSWRTSCLFWGEHRSNVGNFRVCYLCNFCCFRYVISRVSDGTTCEL